MMVRSSSGRSATVASRAALALLLASGLVHAAEAPDAPSSSDLPAALVSPEIEAPYQVARERPRQIRTLDPAIFTDISPLTVPDVGIRLPPDQQE